MNCAEELIGAIRAQLPHEPPPEDLPGKVIRRGFETYEVVGHDPKRRELTLRDSSGREQIKSEGWLYQKVIQEVTPRLKGF